MNIFSRCLVIFSSATSPICVGTLLKNQSKRLSVSPTLPSYLVLELKIFLFIIFSVSFERTKSESYVFVFVFLWGALAGHSCLQWISLELERKFS